MNPGKGNERAWLNRALYPFRPNFFSVPAGRLHYVDEGDGAPVVFVHGNPSWSFEFRQVIAELAGTARCLAVDHLGFGLSDKPSEWSYLPEDHARNLELWLEHLDLREITLVVGDWGGPIGLSYALKHPERVKNLVITNTWCWSVADDWYFQAFSGFVGGPLGRALIRGRNFFVRDLLKALFGDPNRLTPEVHAHYLGPLELREERRGNQVFPQQIIASSAWLAQLWGQREALQRFRTTLVWGDKDIAFRQKELARWEEALPAARTVHLATVGHLVAEEAPQELLGEIQRLLTTPAD